MTALSLIRHGVTVWRSAAHLDTRDRSSQRNDPIVVFCHDELEVRVLIQRGRGWRIQYDALVQSEAFGEWGRRNLNGGKCIRAVARNLAQGIVEFGECLGTVGTFDVDGDLADAIPIVLLWRRSTLETVIR